MTLPLKVAVACGILNVCLCPCLRAVSLDMIFYQYLKEKSMGYVGVFIVIPAASLLLPACLEG